MPLFLYGYFMADIDQILEKIRTCQSQLHVFEIKNKKYIYNNDKNLILRVNNSFFKIFNSNLAHPKITPGAERLLISIDSLGFFQEQKPQISVSSFRKCHLYFDFSNRCNLKCKYCYVQKNEIYQLVPERALSLIKSFVTKNCKSFDEFIIDFCCFGEPLLHFDDLKFIKAKLAVFSDELNVKIELIFTTNTVLLSMEMSDYFISTKQQFGVSFDGPINQHNSNRSDSYDKVINALTMYRNRSGAKRFKYLWASTVVNRAPENLVTILKHNVDFGFDSVILKPSRQLERSKELLQLKKSYWKMVQFLIGEYRKGNIQYLAAILNSSDYFGKHIRSLIRNERLLWRCGAGRHLYLMNQKGEISPCIQFHGESFLRLGDTNSTLNTKVMESLGKTDCCKCWARSLCGGTCYYLNHVYPNDCGFNCELKQSLIEYAIYLIDQISTINSELFRKLDKLILIKEKFFRSMGD